MGAGAGAAAASAAGVPVLLGGSLLIEAGVPLPVPSDLLLLGVGERAAVGALPLWLAMLAVEAVAVTGTTALFLAARGPARTALSRVARRLHLPAAPLARATARLEGGGRATLVVGRLTPGLRTVTAIAAGLSRVPAALAVALLVAGSTVFLQGHVLLGFALGPVADALLARVRVLVIVIFVALVAVAAVAWFRSRGRGDEVGFAEASCPACLVAAAVARTLPSLTAAGPPAGTTGKASQ